MIKIKQKDIVIGVVLPFLILISTFGCSNEIVEQENTEPYELFKTLEGDNWIYELAISERGRNYRYILKADAREGNKYDGSITLGWGTIPEGAVLQYHDNVLDFDSDKIMDPNVHYVAQIHTGISPGETNIILEHTVTENYFEIPNTDFVVYIIYNNQLIETILIE